MFGKLKPSAEYDALADASFIGDTATRFALEELAYANELYSGVIADAEAEIGRLEERIDSAEYAQILNRRLIEKLDDVLSGAA